MAPGAIRRAGMFLAASCLAVASSSTEQVRGYIYDAKGAGDNRALVIDILTRNVEIQDKRDAHLDAPLGDLGGGFDDCSNEKFYCVTGLLEIVVPKAMPMKRWQYHGLSCESTAESKSDAFLITCRSRKYRGTPTFTYSLSRGVISIDSSPIGGAQGRFELRGQLGLMSPGSD